MSGVLTTTKGPGEGGKKKEEKMEEGKEEGRRKMGQIQKELWIILLEIIKIISTILIHVVVLKYSFPINNNNKRLLNSYILTIASFCKGSKSH